MVIRVRSLVSAWALIGGALASAPGCGSSASSASAVPPCEGAACAGQPGEGCPEGFTRDVESGGCLDVTPTEDCAAGTGAFLGSTSCKPVGWSTCAPPFQPDPSGWGCAPIVPASSTSCPDGTMAALGSASCAPIGDCDAPFPPAGATMFVDASFATQDATHFKTIFDAAQSANAGAVIAVAPGTYVEDVDVTRSNVTILGKCAAQVIVQNPGDKRAGVLVTSGARNVVVRGLTLTGHYTGMLVKAGGEGRLEDSVIVKSRYMGAYVAEPKSKLVLARTLIDDVVADGGKFGWGAAAQLGGSLELEDVVVARSTSSGVVIGGAGSTGKITGVIVRGTRPGPDDLAEALGVVDRGAAEVDGALFEDMRGLGLYISGGVVKARHVVLRRTVSSTKGSGRGVQVTMGGRLDLAESRISDSEDGNVLLGGAGVSATIASSVIAGGAGVGPGKPGNHGIRVTDSATLTLTGSALVGNVEVGLSVQDPGTTATADGIVATDTRPSLKPDRSSFLGVGVGVAWGGALSLSHASVVKNHAVGILVSKVDSAKGVAAHAEIASTLVRRGVPEGGLLGRGIEVSAGASAVVEGCAVAENNEESMAVGLEGSLLTVRRTLVRDTRRASGTFGHGLVATDGGSLVLEGAWLLGHPGIAIAVSGGSATVKGSLVATSAVAIHVARGTELQSSDVVPSSPSALACVVSTDTKFVNNETRVGSGSVPLPTPLTDLPRTPSAP